MITKEYFDKHLSKHEKLTVYSEDNVPHTIIKKYHLTTEPDKSLHFELDCKDLEKYCDMFGLSLKPKN